MNQNRDLNDEIRHNKLENTNLQRSLTDAQLVNREKDRLQDMVTDLEVGHADFMVSIFDRTYQPGLFFFRKNWPIFEFNSSLKIHE